MSAPRITGEMQSAFLAARVDAERGGHGGAAYVAGLEAVYPLVVAEAVAAVERNYEKPAGGCACPPEHQRDCGYRLGVGVAADAVRALVVTP